MGIKLGILLNLLDENIVELGKSACSGTEDGILGSIEKRHFINKFSKLAERLIFFREHPLKKTPQIEPLLEALNQGGGSLVQGFTVGRNNLLHKYLYRKNETDERIYMGQFQYFVDNVEILKNSIQKIRNKFSHQLDIEIDKISYDKPIYDKSTGELDPDELSVAQECQKIVMVIGREIELLKQILEYFGVKNEIKALESHEGRISKELFKKLAYDVIEDEKIPEICKILSGKTDENKLCSALENIFENIQNGLTEIENTRKQVKSQFSDRIWELRKALDCSDKQSYDFLVAASRNRADTVHEHTLKGFGRHIYDSVLLLALEEKYLEPIDKILQFVTKERRSSSGDFSASARENRSSTNENSSRRGLEHRQFRVSRSKSRRDEDRSKRPIREREFEPTSEHPTYESYRSAFDKKFPEYFHEDASRSRHYRRPDTDYHETYRDEEHSKPPIREREFEPTPEYPDYESYRASFEANRRQYGSYVSDQASAPHNLVSAFGSTLKGSSWSYSGSVLQSATLLNACFRYA